VLSFGRLYWTQFLMSGLTGTDRAVLGKTDPAVRFLRISQANLSRCRSSSD